MCHIRSIIHISNKNLNFQRINNKQGRYKNVVILVEHGEIIISSVLQNKRSCQLLLNHAGDHENGYDIKLCHI
jgi:hypothetical protein